MPSIWDRLRGRSQSPAAPVPSAKGPRIARGRGVRAEYDGATLGRRAGGWRRTRTDANGELTPAAQASLRGIARDLVRNNPFASAGVARLAEAIVGTGIIFQVYRNGEIDEKLNVLARAHFDTVSCDAAGRHDLYGLQLQAARTIIESGAAVMRRRWRRAADRLPLPFQLQVVEPDYLDAGKHGPLASQPGTQGGFVVYGVQFDPIGRREGYWLYNGHPGATRPTSLGSTFIPAADVAHIFRADRPEQEHGATWFAPVILRTKDFADYEDAQLQRQKVAAAFAGFRYGSDGTGGSIVGNDGETIINPDSGRSIDADYEPMDYVEPGTISDLRGDERIEWSNPPGVDGYVDYARVSQRAIAAGLGIPYEDLTGDMSQVSFISGRLGKLRYRRTVAIWQWQMFIPQFCGAVARWTLDALEALGEDIAGVTLKWTPPATEMMDPASEVPAIRDAIRAGLMTISAAARERGEDPDVFLAEWAADAKLLDDLGLTFDSDPRKVTAVGNPVNAGTVAPRATREQRG